MAGKPVRCVWCEIELTPEDAEPIKYARHPGLPDERNMQCADGDACDHRQDALLAASIVRGRTVGHEALFIKRTPGVLAALEDGERLREAMATLDAVEGSDDRG